MQDILDQVFGYIRGILHYRWYALAVAWLVCIVGWVSVYRLPDQYEASARVYVDTQSVLRPLLKGLVVNVNDPDSQVALMTRTLLSRPNLEKVARMADLDLQAKNSVAMESILNSLQKQIRLSGTGRQNLYSIGFTDEDPNLAKKVVQSLLTIFVENTLGGTRQDSTTAQRFLDRQIADYEARLVAAEKRLTEFKRVNVGLMPSDGKTYYQRMQLASLDLEAARLELEQAQNRRDSLQRQMGGEEPSFGFDPNPVVPDRITPSLALPIQSRIQSMEQQLDSLLLKYTEKHPDVIAAREILADLEKQRDQQLDQIAARQARVPSAFRTPEGLDTNPVYQQMKIALSNEEANIAALQARVDEYQNRFDQLQEKVNTIPDIEAQLVALNRDYDVTRQNYEELLARREAAHISQQAEQSADDIRFKVIEPPRVPSDPAGPNRPLLMSGVMAAGVGVGIALAFVIAQIRPTFDSRRSLTNLTNLPVLGSVGVVLSRVDIRRRRLGMLIFFALSSCLLLIYAVMVVLEATGGLRIPYTLTKLLG